MPEISFEFTPEDNTQKFPKPIIGKYKLKTLTIEADSTKGLSEAIRKMRIYFRFDFFGDSNRNFAVSFPLLEHLLIADELITVIEFEDEIIIMDPKYKCTNAVVSIQDEIYPPVTKMVLTMEHTEL